MAQKKSYPKGKTILAVDDEKDVLDTIADAILDRLAHNAHKISLKGDSMRKLRSNLTKNRNSEKQEIPELLRSDKTGRFPPERLDALPRNKWTLFPEYAAFGSEYNWIEH
jgi:hypothetical protein